MRIAISGASCQGKTTLINDFLDTYTQYTQPEKSYRELITDDIHSKKSTVETQHNILDFMAEQMTQYRSSDNIIFDRCPLDNIVYSLWAHNHGKDGFDHAYIDKSIPLVRETMKFIDIIFFIPITSVAPVKIKPDDQRETDHEYIKETDNLFKAMYQQWLQPESTFFPKDDRPAIIEIFGNPRERMHMIKLYIDADTGDAIDEQGLLDINEMEKIEAQFRNTKDGYTDPNDVNKLLI
jgi:predicted ATPase